MTGPDSTLVEPGSRPRPGRRRDAAVVAIFMAALCLPGLAMLAGVRSGLIENRAAATLPPVSVRAMADPRFYLAVDQAVDDAFPLRAAAVASRALIDYGALGGSSNPDVVVGRDRWLFLTAEVFPRCLWDGGEIVDIQDGLAAEFHEQGIDVRFVVAPDKRTAYPQMLPPVMDARPTCTDTERAAMQAGIARRRETAVDLWGPVLAAIPPGDLHRYYRTDSHWTAEGAAPAIRALVESIQPGLWDAAPPVRAGEAAHVGDLSVLLGLPETERAGVFERSGVTLTQAEIPVTVKTGGVRPVMRYTATGGAAVPGTTLVVCDSFMRVIRDDVAPWFADSVWVHVDDLSRHDDLAVQLPAFDRVIVERGERLAYVTDYELMLRPLLDRP
ncbi:MAG TPA: hypothetical protein VM408_00595 [Methylomirabilota bacterium]|nr:hypothetical protein [Methylomirabilota bacterium]